jgi:inner membrane protein
MALFFYALQVGLCVHLSFNNKQMDSLTQIALGIATAELCAGAKLQRRTFLYGAVLGTLPDLDVAVGLLLNPVEGVALHRGFSHSLFAFLFLSPILGWLISKIEKGKISLRNATNLVCWCLLTHVLLDLFTSWGTQVFWPLPNRVALKTIFVIDPLYTLPLLISLLIAWRKPTFSLRKKYVIRGISISSAYLFLTCGLKLYALQQFKNALEEQHVAYNAIIVKPTAFNCILWNANVATDEAYLLGDYSLFDSQPITFDRYPKNNNLAQELSGNPDFETLKKVSEGWFIISRKENHYYFNDLRFGLLNKDPEQPQFAFRYVFLEEDGQLKAQEVPKQKRDGKALLLNILHRIKVN